MSAQWRGRRVAVGKPWQCWGGACGLSGAALPGQEASGVRLKNRSDNQHIVEEGKWQGVWGGHHVHHGGRCHAAAGRRFWQ